MSTRLSKLHATGNDFLVWSLLEAPGADPEVEVTRLARALCDRHRGVGADGLIVVTPGTDGADTTMLLANADGGIAEMSGNGLRCLAWAAARAGVGGSGTITVDTAAGRRVVDLVRGTGGEVRVATVDMGPVTFVPDEIPLDAASPFDLQAEYHGVRYQGDAAGMGNPHLVLLVDDPAATRVVQHGPHFERDQRFPRGANVEFVAPTPGTSDELTMRVWERGVGETLSCGTGACAAVAVAHRRGLVGDRVCVHVPGGDLTVELGSTIRLGGPVVHVFDVELDLDAFGRTPER